MRPIRFSLSSTPARLRWMVCVAATLVVTTSSARTETAGAIEPSLSAAATSEGQPRTANSKREVQDERAADTSTLSRLRFDLVCEMSWRVMAIRRPYAALEPTPVGTIRHVRSREIVDLEKMVSCDAIACTTAGPSRIVDADSVRIAFVNDRWYQWHVRWRDGRGFARSNNTFDVREAHGICRREPFSGFPPMDPQFAKLGPWEPDLRERARDFPPESEPFR
jgi:hypothetical protein